MQFFSVEFAILFTIFLSFYWFVIKNIFANKLLILTFSYFILFTFDIKFLIFNILFATTIFLISKIILITKSKFWLFLGICFIVANLIFFKFHLFLESNFAEILLPFKLNFLLKSEILMPLGLSFYSFCAITYLLEAYKDSQFKPTLLDTVLYLSFFVTIVSGPIFRAKEFMQKLNSAKTFGDANLILSLLTIAIVKKVLIANRLSEILPLVFTDPYSYDSATLFASLIGYGFMLYCDFSGYINLVTAMGLCMGIELPVNFKKPFSAKNLKEFWSKWHISLTMFLKDYVYIPLGGNRAGFLHTQINVMIVFIISGIWHGSGLGFFIWGILHALGIIFLNILSPYKILKFDYASRIVTFLFVNLLWLFFAMDFMNSAIFIDAFIKNIGNPNPNLRILYFYAFVLVFLYIYPKFDFTEILQKFYCALPAELAIFAISFIMLVVYALMPSGMPNFIYQGF